MTKEEIFHIAKLARLDLSDFEVKKFDSQLTKILDYIQKLNEVNTDNIRPTSHAIEGLKNRFQSEAVLDQTLKISEVLLNAKNSKDGYIVTRAVLK